MRAARILLLTLLTPTCAYSAAGTEQACRNEYKVNACEETYASVDCSCGDQSSKGSALFRYTIFVPSNEEAKKMWFHQRFFLKRTLKQELIVKSEGRMVDLCKGRAGKVKCYFP